MVQLVNGFHCHNSADAALARRGIDPAGLKQAAPKAALQPAAPPAQATPPAADPQRTGRGQLVNILA